MDLERNKVKKIAKGLKSGILSGSFLTSIQTLNTIFERFCGKMKLKINLINQKITKYQNLPK